MPRIQSKVAMMQGEEQLVAQIRRGDTEALARFIEARRWQLLAYIERHSGPALRTKVEPEDILQETSGEAVRSLSSVDLSSRDPFGWLCQVAERRIIDAHRRFFGAKKRAAGREVSLDAPAAFDTSRAGLRDLLVASMTTASQVLSRNMRMMRVNQALATLPEEQREALRLRYVEGLPSKEIAKRLGKTDGAIRVMLTRSLDRLQALLNPEAAS